MWTCYDTFTETDCSWVNTDKVLYVNHQYVRVVFVQNKHCGHFTLHSKVQHFECSYSIPNVTVISIILSLDNCGLTTYIFQRYMHYILQVVVVMG